MTKIEATNAAQAIHDAGWELAKAIRMRYTSGDDYDPGSFELARKERIAAALKTVQREAGRIRSLYLANL